MGADQRDRPLDFARLGELARSVGAGQVPKAADALGEHRAAEAFERARAAGPWRGRFAGWGIAAAMAALVAAVVVLRVSDAAPSWTVDGSDSRDTRYVHAFNDRDATVRFSEGSELMVRAGGRLRIADAGRRTIKAVLESGAARVRISGRSAVGFRIAAGPFAVAPRAVASLMIELLADELLRVRVFEGESWLEGIASPLLVRAGQEVSANARDGTVAVRPIALAEGAMGPAFEAPALGRAASEPISAPATPPPEPLQPERGAPVIASPGANAAARRLSWPEAIAAGDYKGVVLDAERRGVAAVLAEGPLADVAALADAARLGGRNDLARRALLAERARFARSDAARDAAFFLGRMADDVDRAPAGALPWYEAYLSEAPNGHFAAEALGRKMVVVARQSGRAAAKDVAAEYLRRFPGGAHAGFARGLASD